MAFIKKYLPWLIAAVLLSGIYFFTRIYNILALPIFTDEAIYIRWAQIAGQDASWRFISLTDGKQPLFIWLSMFTLKVFEDPLFAGRMASVLAGFGTMIGLYFLASEVFKNRKVGIIASLLYLIYPFALINDRMALYDSLVALSMVWALYLEVLLVRKLRLDIALILALVIGAGLLNKSSAFFAIYLLPFSLFLFDFKQKERTKKLVKWMALAAVASILAYAYYSILRLSPFFHIIEEKNAVFIYPFSEWIQHPFTFFWGNLRGLSGWFLSYITPPVLLLILGSFIFQYKKEWREKIFLLVWFSAPFIALALFGRVLYPRYIFFMTMPLLVLAAYSLDYLISLVKKPVLQVGVVLIFLSMMIYSSFLVITDISKAPIADADQGQYVNNWSAGNGVKEAVAFFEKEAKDKKIFIATQGTFGLMPYALEIYLVNNPNVKIQGYWPISENLPQDIQEASQQMPTYTLFYQPCKDCPEPGVPPKDWPVSLVKEYQQGESDYYLRIYKIVGEK